MNLKGVSMLIYKIIWCLEKKAYCYYNLLSDHLYCLIIVVI